MRIYDNKNQIAASRILAPRNEWEFRPFWGRVVVGVILFPTIPDMNKAQPLFR